ncbi:MAG TPA: type II toxin-antitoxin system HicA family toxin [Kofleriaceae bacterium]|nr:type II toxin-antitoxin system HicA family toxin [Kofleriaceae bacterium]
MPSAEVLRILQAAGWRVVRIKGSHHHLRHDARPGTVTVPHPRKDIPRGTLRSIEKQSGCKLR